MSRRANCWDNAVAESFFGTLKTELVHNIIFMTKASAKFSVAEWIDVFYNGKRRHSTIGYVAAAEYERQYYAVLRQPRRRVGGITPVSTFSGEAQSAPLWVTCDEVPRAPTGSGGWVSVSSAAGTTDPNPVRVVAVFGAREFENARLGSAEDPWPKVEALVRNVRVPLSAVRIYQGQTLSEQIDLQMRGA